MLKVAQKVNMTARIRISYVSNEKEFLEFQFSFQNQLSFLTILVNISISGMKLALDMRQRLQREAGGLCV